MTLYNDLEIDPAATDDEIKAARNRAVKKHHPDKGGDREKFDRAQRAYLVLIDPISRADYDRTGRADGPDPNSEESEAWNLVTQAFSQLLVNADPVRTDIIAGMKRMMQDGLNEIANRLASCDRDEKKLAEFKKRLKVKKAGGNGVLVGLVDGRIRDVAFTRAQLQRAERVHTVAKGLVDEYGYDFDQAPVSQYQAIHDAMLNRTMRTPFFDCGA